MDDGRSSVREQSPPASTKREEVDLFLRNLGYVAKRGKDHTVEEVEEAQVILSRLAAAQHFECESKSH